MMLPAKRFCPIRRIKIQTVSSAHGESQPGPPVNSLAASATLGIAEAAVNILIQIQVLIITEVLLLNRYLARTGAKVNTSSMNAGLKPCSNC